MFLKPQPTDFQYFRVSTAPVSGPENLALLFERQCEAHAEALAYCFLSDSSQPSKTLSYGQLRQEAWRIAAWLADQTQVGDRVLLAFAPGLDFACAFWACLLAGRVAVPVPAPDRMRLHRSGPRLRSLIADSRATLVLTSATMLDGAAAVLEPELFAMTRWAALPEPAAQAVSATGFVPPAIDAGSVAYLQYTSGSTSSPRGVKLSHANVIANARAWIDVSTAGPGSRILCWLPHFHDYGLVLGVLSPLLAGGSSYLMSPLSFLRRPLGWLEAVETYRITHTGGPDSAYATCLQAMAGKPLAFRLDSLISLTCGAEPIRAETVERILTVFCAAGMDARALAPAYGLAEAVLGVSSRAPDAPLRVLAADPAALRADRFVPDTAPGAARLVGLGRALAQTEILIVADGQVLPEGGIGEIWVRSPSVGQGYWMQPEASAAVFGGYLADGRGPFLRTGDLGFLDDGELFVTGRSKDLVIIHGENHYPQDLEWTAERAHPGLRRGHGAAFSVQTPSGEALVLALECDRRVDAAEAETIHAAVRRAIAQEQGLPLHALALVRAGKLPRTSSGKVQRQRARDLFLSGELPALKPPAELAHHVDDAVPALSGAGRSDSPMPRDPIEQTVWDIWSEVLDTRAFGIHQSFFELGGNSLRLTQVLSRIEARFGMMPPLAELFEHASVARMASWLSSRPNEASSRPVAGIEPVSRDRPLPVSLSQRRMWLIQHFDPASTAYNVPIALRLHGVFEQGRCQQALDLMVQRHEGLRTRFVMGVDEPMQSIVPQLSVPLEFIDLRELPAAQRSAAARTLLLERLAQPFDLERAPLHRLTLLRLGEREHVLLWVLHHAIIDNWGAALLMREALSAYGALANGRAVVATPPAIGYADYAAWQRRPDSFEARKVHLVYWVERLRGLPELDLSADFPRPAHASHKGARVSAVLPFRLREAMQKFSQSRAVTPFVVYLSAFALMLGRQANSEDLAVGVPIANRHRLAAEHLVGTLVNTLVMRTDLSGDPSFTQLVQRVGRNAQEAYAHQDAPFDELIEALGHDRTLHPQGPVRVLFNVLNAPIGAVELFGLDIEEFDFERCAAQFDLSLHIDTEFGHRVHLEYATELYAAATAERMLENYLVLIERLMDRPEQALSRFELLADTQLNLLRNQWNGEQVPPPALQRVHDYLDLGAPEIAERVAVIDAEGRTLSYGRIEALSNQLAHLLRRHGISRGRRVGLCIERSPWMLIAQLAVLKAGAAYVPLDPDYPVDRLRFMASDADLSMVLAQTTSLPILEGLALPTLLLDDEQLLADSPSHAPSAQPELDATPADEAYLIYTSGSTGRPKGVRIAHRGVVNFLAGMVTRPGLAAEDCVLAITSPSFDPSVLDLMLPLVVRAKVVIASARQVRDTQAVRALLEQHQVSLLQATPSVWRALIDSGWMGGRGFRALIGGEPLPPVLAERLLERTLELWNIYGPTETTVWTTAWKVESPRKGIAIGRPIANTSVWVLDSHGHVCPIGVPGELYVGGAGVGLGYHHRDDLTAKHFVRDPFNSGPESLLYRTGDLGRWRHDGLLEHLGRADHQVKLRGHRIELGEIESVLLDHPGVSNCVALTRALSEEDVRLVMYFVGHEGAVPTAETLRSHLRERLPLHMIPQHFVALEAMPRLPNGKIDRSALPAPVLEPQTRKAAVLIAPETPNERMIAGIWSELLGAQDIYCADNFFDLGGHSLLAMRAVKAIRDASGLKIEPTRLIYESLRQLAATEDGG